MLRRICYHQCMDTLAYVKTRLAACSWAQLNDLSRAVSVPVNTLYRIKTGRTKNPGVIAVDKLRAHFEAQQ